MGSKRIENSNPKGTGNIVSYAAHIRAHKAVLYLIDKYNLIKMNKFEICINIVTSKTFL